MAAKRRRARPKSAVWLTAVVLAALAVTWLLAAGKEENPAAPPASGRERVLSGPAMGDYAPAADVGAAAARPEAVPPQQAGAEPPTRTEPLPELKRAGGVDRQRILDTLEEWARSWSEQRVDDYLALYSPEFRSTQGRSLEVWSGLRRQRILEPAFIEVVLDQIEVEALGPDRAAARFVQSYSSDSFNDQVVKLLELSRDEEGWRIVAEQAAP